MLQAVLASCGGFLLAVLWFDLMFDVQVLGVAEEAAPDAVASIAAYYARVTIRAVPMNRLVAGVMVVGLVTAAWDVVRHARRRGMRLVALALLAAPIALAAVRVVPDAVRLGSGVGTPGERLALAQGILRDHVLCFAAVAAFLGVELFLASREDAPAIRRSSAAPR